MARIRSERVKPWTSKHSLLFEQLFCCSHGLSLNVRFLSNKLIVYYHIQLHFSFDAIQLLCFKFYRNATKVTLYCYKYELTAYIGAGKMCLYGIDLDFSVTLPHRVSIHSMHLVFVIGKRADFIWQQLPSYHVHYPLEREKLYQRIIY